MLLYLKISLVILLSIILTSCGKEGHSSQREPTKTIQIENKDKENEIKIDHLKDEENITQIQKDINKTIQISNFINNENCDQIIESEFKIAQRILSICYDYNYKSAKYVNYTLDGNLVNELNLKDRLRFYTDQNIPKEYQATYKDYTYSGYDRGHLAPDADFDYDVEDLKVTYSMANIIPQDPNVNRYFWTKLERYERFVTTKLKILHVIIGVEFDENPNRIGDNKIAIPKGFWKILWNEKENYRKCFYYNNFVLGDADKDKLRNHEVDCNNLIL
jgi:endonuclease G